MFSVQCIPLEIIFNYKHWKINLNRKNSKWEHKYGRDLQILVSKPNDCMKIAMSFRYVGRYPRWHWIGSCALFSVYF